MQSDQVTANFDELARLWWEAAQLATGSRDERKRWEQGVPHDVAAGWERVREVVGLGGEAAISLVTALLESAPDEAAVAAVGAGPLEDLIVAHGDALAHRLDELARRSAKFRRSLSSVWLEPADLGPDASRRLAPWIPALSNLGTAPRAVRSAVGPKRSGRPQEPMRSAAECRRRRTDAQRRAEGSGAGGRDK